MATNNVFKSDLNRIHYIVQNAMTLYPKEIIIATLKDFFSNDTTYHYTRDQWGFAKTPDHTDLEPRAGYGNDATTRLFIGENYRYDVVYYPSIIVRSGGSNDVPISFNRETGSVKYQDLIFEDGYGNVKSFRSPKAFIFAGAWEGAINIDISARDIRARDDLADLIAILFRDIAFNNLYKSGIIVTKVSVGAPTDTEDRNDKLFKVSVSLSIRSEWRREIPVGNIIETINFGIEFGRIPEGPIAPNLTIHINENLLDVLSNL